MMTVLSDLYKVTQYCDNNIEITGKIWELCIDIIPMNDTYKLSYHGVILCEENYFTFYGNYIQSDLMFFEFLDNFGITNDIIDNFSEEDYTTHYDLINAGLLLINVKNKSTFASSNDDDCLDKIYIKGVLKNNFKIESRYIKRENNFSKDNIQLNVIGILDEIDTINNSCTLYIPNQQYHYALKLYNVKNLNGLKENDIVGFNHLKYLYKINNNVIESLYEFEVELLSLNISCNKEIVDQIKFERQTYLNMINKYGKSSNM